jgi:hypothetical protein
MRSESKQSRGRNERRRRDYRSGSRKIVLEVTPKIRFETTGRLILSIPAAMKDGGKEIIVARTLLNRVNKIV